MFIKEKQILSKLKQSHPSEKCDNRNSIFHKRKFDFKYQIPTKSIIILLDKASLNNEYYDIINILEKSIKERNRADENLANDFLQIKNRSDLFKFLRSKCNLMFNDAQFNQHIYNQRYKVFNIPKKNGGFRKIYAPNIGLKLIQFRINYILQLFYKLNNNAHGFIKNRNIITNAIEHTNKVSILNIDLKRFFPSIRKIKISELFPKTPFNFNEETTNVLAQICCYKNILPQGAPTSPTLSNYICHDLDFKLNEYALKNNCKYTRYADDLTFSYQTKIIDIKDIKDIKDIILSECFNINKKKLRITYYTGAMIVTGLVCNRKVNVRRNHIRKIRAILHNIKINGVQKEKQKYVKKYKLAQNQISTQHFLKIIRGRINFIGDVRGKEDSIYKKLLENYNLIIKVIK